MGAIFMSCWKGHFFLHQDSSSRWNLFTYSVSHCLPPRQLIKGSTNGNGSDSNIHTVPWCDALSDASSRTFRSLVTCKKHVKEYTRGHMELGGVWSHPVSGCDRGTPTTSKFGTPKLCDW